MCVLTRIALNLKCCEQCCTLTSLPSGKTRRWYRFGRFRLTGLTFERWVWVSCHHYAALQFCLAMVVEVRSGIDCLERYQMLVKIVQNFS